MWSRLVGLSLCLSLAACGPAVEDEVDAAAHDAARADAGVDAAGADVGGVDAGAVDSARPDQANPDLAQPDAARPDTAQPDSAQPDTAAADTAAPDSAAADTVSPDSSTPDAGVGDAPAPDTGLDGGGVDPEQMVSVPVGSFWMGCNASLDSECDSAESPYHEVAVPAFEIDLVEVTVGQYAACVDASACTEPASSGETVFFEPACSWDQPDGEALPINCVDWAQAAAYCAWAGKRLCTESEWEKAARGGCELYTDCAAEARVYPWGNSEATCALAIMDDHGVGCGSYGPSAVGSRPAGASPYGALDMTGNIQEWVQDCWHIDYNNDELFIERPDDGSAWEEPACADALRVVRGGSWYYYARDMRASSREGRIPGYLSGTLGFRCCR